MRLALFHFLTSTILLNHLPSIHAQGQPQSSSQPPSSSSPLLESLRQAGLTTFASALDRANRSEDGQRLLAALSDTSRNVALFAPDNAAFQAPAAATLSDDPEELASVLSYHILPGNFANTTASTDASNNNGNSNGTLALASGVAPFVTAGRTILTNASFVNLEGGKGQVLVWSRNGTGGQVAFLNQSPRVVVRNTTSSLNGQSHLLLSVVSGILWPPRGLRQTMDMANLAAFGGLLSSIDASFYGSATNRSFMDALAGAGAGDDFGTGPDGRNNGQDANGNTRGFTMFVPTDAAMRAAGNKLDAMRGDEKSIAALLGNHYINGTSYYSPTLFPSSSSPSSSYTSESGQSFTFSTNSSGWYVTSGSSTTAKIVRSDVLVRNGVIHVIDDVLMNSVDDDSKGESAYRSATSVAAQPTTETGPIGPASTGGSNSSGGSNGAGSGRGRTNGAKSTTISSLSGVFGSSFPGLVGGGVLGLLWLWLQYA